MKRIVVVGYSSGIGNALATLLAGNNKVYGTFYRKDAEERNENISSHYFNVLDETLDLGFLPDQLDGLVYCPGNINLRPFARLKEEDFIADYKLQVTGAVKVIQACLPKLKAASKASIVLFSTVAVQMGFSFHSIVSASKGAIEGLTRALAAELAPSIRVNCIAPSITNTPLASGVLGSVEKTEANAQRHPLKRVGDAADIAHAAAYLLSNDSSWVTGQVLHIDGGMSSVR